LLQAVKISSVLNAAVIAKPFFLFMMSPFLECCLNPCHSDQAGANATATRGICFAAVRAFAATNSTANPR